MPIDRPQDSTQLLSKHAAMKAELEQITHDYARLQESIGTIHRYLDLLDTHATSPHPPTAEADPAVRVKHLVEAYRELKHEKDEVVKRYAADYRKWRRFKQWLRGRHAGEDTATTRRAPLGKENAADIFGDATPIREEEPPHSKPPCTPKKDPLSPSRFEANSPTSPARSATLINSVLATMASMERGGDEGAPPAPPAPAQKAKPRNFSEPRNMKRKFEELDATPHATKGKGRYAQPRSEKPTKSHSLLKNDPGSFKYDEVVRNKRERMQLHGGDCECCRDYYRAIGPLPSRPQAPLWRTPPSSPSKHPRPGSSKLSLDGEANNDDDDDLGDFAEEMAEHKRQISRHRHRWEAPMTPPGYWDISFPDTQQVEDINVRAQQIHAKKARTEAEPKSTSRKQKR